MIGVGTCLEGEKTVPWRETVDFFNDDRIFDEELSILFGGATASVIPTWGDGIDRKSVV